VAVTAASFGFNVATAGRDRPASALYPGPFLRVGETEVAYHRWGRAGSPIVLLGGFAEASWVWQAVGRELGARHRVFALDLPPFGYSSRAGVATLASWIALVDGFDRRLSLQRPVLVGHSLGAAVAAGEALRHPSTVGGIVLLDGDALSGGRPGWLARLAVDPYYTTLFRIATDSDWLARRIIADAYGRDHRPRLTHAALAAWERPFDVTGTASAFRRMLPLGIQGFAFSELKPLDVRRLVVWGADDTVDSVSAGRKTASAIHAPFDLIPQAGHLSMLTSPRAVARAIERFAG